MAIRVDAFRPLAEVKARADQVSREIQASRPLQRGDRLYPPGLLEAEFEQHYAADGIPLNAETLVGLRRAADALGVRIELGA